MNDPVGWRIQKNLYEALHKINGRGSYFYNTGVEYRENDDNTFNALDVLIGSNSITRNDERLHQSKTDWNHVFAIYLALPVGDASNAEKDQRLMRAFTDVTRAVMADPRRGDLAHDTFVLGFEPSEDGSKRLSCTVSVQVTYRTDEQDLTLK